MNSAVENTDRERLFTGTLQVNYPFLIRTGLVALVLVVIFVVHIVVVATLGFKLEFNLN